MGRTNKEWAAKRLKTRNGPRSGPKSKEWTAFTDTDVVHDIVLQQQNLTLPSVHRDFGASSVLLQQVFHKIRRRRRRESFEGVWCGRCDAPTSKKLKNRGFRRAPKARGEKNVLFWVKTAPKIVSKSLLEEGTLPPRWGGGSAKQGMGRPLQEI